MTLTHLASLEAESIYVLREVASAFERPVLLYSIGKDSSVLLHLARKAFFPSPLPFPLLHIDTNWNFREMLAFRDETAKRLGLDLLVHTNREGLERKIDPFRQPGLHTDVMKTEALIQALDKYAFDAAIGGARRDEEQSRAKERVFSFRSSSHLWDPKNQRPEFWQLYNGRIKAGETVRAFPLSNWTEIDIWRYILTESIPVVPLYLAAPRPVVERDGIMLVVDDDRMQLHKGEKPAEKMVRFRTLGCYPLTGAMDSAASSPEDIIAELPTVRMSERSHRLIDDDRIASMEQKKVEGYF